MLRDSIRRSGFWDGTPACLLLRIARRGGGQGNQADRIVSLGAKIRDGFHIVPGLGNEPRGPRTEVLVKLELSCRALPGQIDKPTATHLGAIGDGRQDVIAGQLRILLQDLFHGHS